MAKFEVFKRRLREPNVDSIATALQNPSPSSIPPHVDDINLLTSAILEQEQPNFTEPNGRKHRKIFRVIFRI